jgi:hypothetical protein
MWTDVMWATKRADLKSAMDIWTSAFDQIDKGSNYPARWRVAGSHRVSNGRRCSDRQVAKT